MALELPDLDDINYARLRDQAVQLVPLLAPEWTDHNASDPGITLIELLAWLAEIEIYRLNRVPAATIEAFLRLVGVQRRPPQPARVRLWPDGDGPRSPVRLPTGTTVALMDAPELEFRTERTTWLTSARITRLTSVQGEERIDVTGPNRTFTPFYPFGEAATAGASIEIEVDPWFDVPSVALAVDVADDATDDRPQGAGRPVSGSVLAWEYRHRDGTWRRLGVAADSTAGLLRTGRVILRPPDDGGGGPGATRRIRARLAHRDSDLAPRLRRLGLNAVDAVQVTRRRIPVTATGEPDQAVPLNDFRLHGDHPASARLVSPPQVLVEGDGSWERWQILDHDFRWSGPHDPVFRFDADRSTVELGNGVNGRMPATGTTIAVDVQETQGPAGNVPAGRRWAVEEPVAGRGVWRNERSAAGGAARESLDDAKERAQGELWSGIPLVTATDIEARVRSTPGVRVAKVSVIPAYCPEDPCYSSSEHMTVVVLPVRRPRVAGRASPVPAAVLDAIVHHLEPVRLVTDVFHVVGPHFVEVGVSCRVVVEPSHDRARVVRDVKDRLGVVLDPAAGVPGGDPQSTVIGRPVFASELSEAMHAVPGVLGIEGLTLRAAGATATDRMAVGPTGVRCPGPLEVTAITPAGGIGQGGNR